MVMSAILKDIRAAFGDVEATPYTVVVQRGGYEERMYPARRWVCTTMSGPSRHALVTPMFRRLFCYISGRNEPNLRIDMTTPVTTLVEASQGDQNNRKNTTTCLKEEKGREEHHNGSCNAPNGTTSSSSSSSSSSPCSSSSSSSPCSSLPIYTMGFLVPASHQDKPPDCSDKSIFIEERPKMVVFARRFSGYMNDEVVCRELAALHEAIRSNGDDANVDFAKYYVAGYDPPFKLLGRRNELWVVKEIVEEEQNGCGGCSGEVAVVSNGCCVEKEKEVDGKGGVVVDDDVEMLNENGNDELVS